MRYDALLLCMFTECNRTFLLKTYSYIHAGAATDHEVLFNHTAMHVDSDYFLNAELIFTHAWMAHKS